MRKIILSKLATLCCAVACAGALASVMGCQSALASEDATTLRITNIGRDTVAVFPWNVETANRSLRTFGGVALRESAVTNGLIAAGASRDFPLDAVLGYTSGASIRLEVLSIRRDSVFENHAVTITGDELARRGFRADVSLR